MPGYEIFGDAERKEVMEVLETGVLMRYGFDQQRKGIWKAKELEGYIAEKMGVKYCQLTTSGTTALCTALAVAGVGAGDEVILPTFTFVASFEAVISVGAVPILADIDESLTLDPASVRSKITSHTKAILPVHMCGAQSDLETLLAICREHNLLLIEDACQSTGATYKGKPLGSWGTLGCFSFDFVKTVTMGEGGAVITNDDDLAVKADGYTDHGHDHKGVDRGADLHPFMGLNYRVSELSAAVGLAQFRKLDEILVRQRQTKKQIKEALKSEFPQLKFRTLHDESGDSATFLSFFLPSLEQARRARTLLAEEGVTGVFHYYDNNWHYIRQWHHLRERQYLCPLPSDLLNRLPDYQNLHFPISDDVIGRNLSMAINLCWDDAQIAERIAGMKRAIGKALQSC